MAVATNENLRIILTAVDNASRVFKTVNKSVENTQKKLDNATAGAKKFTKVVGVVGTVVGGLAVKEFMGFEKQMSKVQAITGANSEEFKKMTALAKKMGATTAFTWKEAGDALEFLGMAGLSVKESMDALPGALELASAGNLTLWESADIATNIMAQFWIKAENIGRVNDVLAKSATTANTSVQEMAEAMKYMWPVANALKVPLEETASAINILANNGIKGGMAGQSFSASLLRITKLTPNMQKSVDALNLSLFDANGEYVGLTDTIKQLEEGTKSMTDEEKAKHISTLFGIQSTKQWLTLLKEGSGEMETYTESLENAEGSARKMAETQLDNLAGSFTLLKSAISGAMIEIGGAISVYLRPAMDWLTEKISNWRTEWESLSPGMQKLIKNIGLIAGGLTALVLVIGTVSIVLTPIIAGFGLLTSTLWVVTTAVTVLGKAMLFLTANPIGMLITAIGALIYVGYQFYKNWDDITLGAKYAWSLFSTAVSEKITWIKTGISDFLTSVSTWFSEKWTSIKDTVSTILDLIKTVITFQFNLYLTIITTVIDGIKWVWENGLNIIKDLVTTVTETISGIWSTVMDTMKNIATTAWNSITGVVGGVIDGLTSKFTGFYDKIKGIYDKVKGWLSFLGIWSSQAEDKASEVKARVDAKKASDAQGARAIGGPVSRGGTYLVGEEGPELFTPGTSGRISPNSASGGSTPNISINIQVDGSQDPVATAEAIKAELANSLQMYKFGIS